MKPPGAKSRNLFRNKLIENSFDLACRILWEFLYILLEDSQYESIIHWENREKMIFRIIQADKLAALWGKISFSQPPHIFFPFRSAKKSFIHDV